MLLNTSLGKTLQSTQEFEFLHVSSNGQLHIFVQFHIFTVTFQFILMIVRVRYRWFISVTFLVFFNTSTLEVSVRLNNCFDVFCYILFCSAAQLSTVALNVECGSRSKCCWMASSLMNITIRSLIRDSSWSSRSHACDNFWGHSRICRIGLLCPRDVQQRRLTWLYALIKSSTNHV